MSEFTIDGFLEPGEIPTFDFATEKARFISHMDGLKNMSVEESTFWKKWVEMKEYQRCDIGTKSAEVRAKIWRPFDINDSAKTIQQIKELSPRIFYVDPTNVEHMSDWLMLRIFCHSMAYDQTPGRFLRFLVVDDTTNKYLGAASLSNDVMALTCRDNFIGWSAKNRCEEKMLIHSAIGSCIMGTQPFGYNFLGGKLVASLILSKHVRDTWESVVGKKLVGMTTTSLYGPNSMYCGIPYWQGCGTSMGKISLKPDDKFYNLWHEDIKKNNSDEYTKKIVKLDPTKGPVTGIKQRILEIIFRKLEISAAKYHHGFERGVYYSPFYEQTKDFLCKKIDGEPTWNLLKKFESDSAGMIDWWREKAIKRYSKLYVENRLKPEILYYNKLMDMEYETAKSEYFNDVGR